MGWRLWNCSSATNHNEKLVQTVKTDWLNADVSPKLKALLNFAGKVQEGGKQVKAEDIAAGRAPGLHMTRTYTAHEPRRS